VLRLRQAAGHHALRSRRFLATASRVTAAGFLGAAIVQWYVAAAMSACGRGAQALRVSGRHCSWSCSAR
jgi:hypothetical protein